MAGSAAARALTPAAAAQPVGAALSLLEGPDLSLSKGRFEVLLATAVDEADVRRLLREHPLAGDVAVSLEREPDSRVATGIEGDVHQTLVARERRTNRIAAIASRSVRDAFVNGRPARVGYLGQLRIASGFGASRALLDSGFAFCRELHDAGDARVYLTSIVAANHAARRLLLGMRSRSAPRFEPAGALSTLILPRGLPRRSSLMKNTRAEAGGHAGIEIRQGSRDLLDEIAACLWRNGERRQFAPCWTAGDLSSPDRAPDLSPEHFLVAARAGRVVGCVACWDQRRFKQVIVRGYSPQLTRWRPMINLLAPWLGIPRLPEVGCPLEFVYLSHLAVDGDDIDTATALIAAAPERLPSDIDYVVTAVADGSPLLPALRRRFRHREYRSLLYLAYWPDGERVVRTLDGRLPHPEVAVL